MKPKTLIVTRCIITNDDNQILLLKRASDRMYNSDMYELPGSKIEPLMDIKTSVVDSIQKELNITVIPYEPEQRVYLYNRLVTEPTKYQNHLYIEITLEAKYVVGNITISEDHTEYKWVDLEDAFHLPLAPGTKNTLTKYALNKKTKSLIESRPKLQISSRAVIYDKNKILMLRRNKRGEFPGKWEFPGGKIENFETLDYIVREVFEETGLIIRVTCPLVMTTSTIVKSGKYKGYTFIGIFDEAKLVGGKFKLSDEHIEYGWFTKKKLLNLDLAEYVKFAAYKLFT